MELPLEECRWRRAAWSSSRSAPTGNGRSTPRTRPCGPRPDRCRTTICGRGDSISCGSASRLPVSSKPWRASPDRNPSLGCRRRPYETRCSASPRSCTLASSTSSESSRTALPCTPGHGVRSSTTSCCAPRGRRAGTSSPSTASPTTGRTSTDARDSKASMRFCGAAGSGSPKAWTDDSPETETANGLANRKGAMLASRLRERGVTESLGARRYLEAAHRAGVKCAAISASANTSKVLELSGLAALIDVRIDAEVMRSECLRSLPAPDVLLAACRRLDVLPAEAATFTSSPAGVAAGRSAGLAIIGVGDADHAELLAGFGAERVVPSLRSSIRGSRSGDGAAGISTRIAVCMASPTCLPRVTSRALR